jgi:hypothetical protein
MGQMGIHLMISFGVYLYQGDIIGLSNIPDIDNVGTGWFHSRFMNLKSRLRAGNTQNVLKPSFEQVDEN